eukprot:g4474.t1
MRSLLFSAAPWVDQTKAPGATPQPQSWGAWLRATVTLKYMFRSPNLAWMLIAVCVYLVAPYRISELSSACASDGTGADAQCKAALWSGFFLRRLLVNFSVAGAYYGFWHASLYHWGCSRRKYAGIKVNGTADRYEPRTPFPSLRTMVQNLWYWSLGVLQWACWETCFVFLYASGRLPYIHDDQVWRGGYALRFVLLALLVPIWRGAHFYFSHRLLHVRPLYRFVHSVHHRNVDIEPFAGLCMHPTEHLFYWVCVAPSLYVLGSPFHLLWNGMHLLLSPGASHSGWEDHAQGDQFHYLHHAKFECNYGSASMPFDFSNGTFRDRLKTSSKEADKSSSLRPALRESKPLMMKDALPNTRWDAMYHLICLAIASLVIHAGKRTVLFSSRILPSSSATAVALIVAAGPVAAAVVLRIFMGDRLSARWPFHREPVCGAFGAHLVLGVLMTVVPTYHTVEALLRAPGEAVACGWLNCAPVS